MEITKELLRSKKKVADAIVELNKQKYELFIQYLAARAKYLNTNKSIQSMNWLLKSSMEYIDVVRQLEQLTVKYKEKWGNFSEVEKRFE